MYPHKIAVGELKGKEPLGSGMELCEILCVNLEWINLA
jgi:hypothetical protein